MNVFCWFEGAGEFPFDVFEKVDLRLKDIHIWSNKYFYTLVKVYRVWSLCLSFLPVLTISPPAKGVISPNLLQKAKSSLILGLLQTSKLWLELVSFGYMVCKEVVKYDVGCNVIDVVYLFTIVRRESIFDCLAKLTQLCLGYGDWGNIA